MLGKKDHGAKARGEFPDEAGVSGEPLDVAFIATVEEDGAQPHPALGAYQVPLRESRELREAEVVDSLLEESGFVTVLCSNNWVCELAEELYPFSIIGRL